jgi:hypothetical protein
MKGPKEISKSDFAARDLKKILKTPFTEIDQCLKFSQCMSHLTELYHSDKKDIYTRKASPYLNWIAKNHPDTFKTVIENQKKFTDLHDCSAGAVYYWLKRRIILSQHKDKPQLLLLIPGKGNHTPTKNKSENGKPPLQQAILDAITFFDGHEIVNDHGLQESNPGRYYISILPGEAKLNPDTGLPHPPSVAVVEVLDPILPGEKATSTDSTHPLGKIPGPIQPGKPRTSAAAASADAVLGAIPAPIRPRLTSAAAAYVNESTTPSFVSTGELGLFKPNKTKTSPAMEKIAVKLHAKAKGSEH